ncbi:MAG: TonB-dependent receptor plug domain-containing protein [Alphaproteobacteria bacterium]|nr:TonB-dependent receptor plug domain-containing protein [Alphaproteobacteria bacterium]
MTTRPPPRLPSALLALALLWSVPALAAPKDEARRHFAAGLELVEAGAYEAGIEEFQRAYDKVPHPVVLYNIARAYTDLGDYEAAIRYYELYLAGAPPDAAEVEQVITVLELRLAQQRGASTPEASTTSASSGAPTGGGTATAEEIAALRRHAEELAQIAQSLADREAKASAEASTTTTSPTEPGLSEPPPEIAVPTQAPTVDPYQRVVVTASRFGQDPLDSPSAVTLITQDDIRLSAANSIPELLQQVPGVDVMQLTAGQHDLSIRGFNRRLSNKVLVLVDGRSVYLDFIGTVLWAGLPISLEDIDRIEVIRGPGAAIYGANAFGGVINIITRSPGDPSYADEVSVRGGTTGSGRASLVVSGREDLVSYRAGASYITHGRWSQETDLSGRQDLVSDVEDQDNSTDIVSGNAQLDWRFGQKGYGSVSGGYSQGNIEFYSLGALRDFHMNQRTAFARADLGWGPIYLRTFYNHFDGDARNWYYRKGEVNLEGDIASNVLDAELVGDFALDEAENHRLTAGLGYRFKQVDWDFLEPNVPNQHHYSVYVQEQSRFGPLTLSGAGRVDRHPYPAIGFRPSGRLAAILHVDEGRAVRVNVGNAFRTPTFLEAFTALYLPTGVEGVQVRTTGDYDNIAAEGIVAVEAGYLDHSSDSWRAEVNAFGYRVSGLIDLSQINALDPEEFPGAEPYQVTDVSGTFLAGESSFVNEQDIYWAYGGEVSGSWFGISGLDISGSYAYERVRVQDIDAAAGEDAFSDYRTNPSHKVNASAAWRTPWQLDLGMQGTFISAQEWPLRSFNADGSVLVQPVALDPYVVLSNRLVWHPMNRDDVDVSLIAWNWLASVMGPHREHPIGQPVGARYQAALNYRF